MIRRLLALFALACGLAAAQGRPIPVLFDTDIGDDIDDALALALIAAIARTRLAAVTTVIDRSAERTRLAWKELGLYGRRTSRSRDRQRRALSTPNTRWRARSSRS